MQFESYPFEKLNKLLKPITPNANFSPLTLTIGEPQFDTPLFIKETLASSVSMLNKYPKTAGEAYLKEAMVSYNKRRFGLSLDISEIVPTFGTREVLFNFPQFLLHEKQNPVMVFPNPFYQIYEGAAKASKATIIHLCLDKNNHFTPQIDESVLKDANLVILNSPNNPTGSVMSFENLQEWVRLALKYNFVLLNDECYIDLYSNEPTPSILNASIACGNKTFKNVLAINSISKRSSAPGLRSGYIAGDKEILKSYLEYRTYVGCASPLPLQVAAAKAWGDQSHVEIFRTQYKANLLLAKEILGVKTPEATFYVWLQVTDELEFTKRLYRDFNLKVLPGSFLGREGAGVGYVRLALVYGEQQTKDALLRIKKLIEQIKKEAGE
ncbi:MAG TPA: succinyldiaminopimelate transaminase [Epsilonproteobacteria bacterium]|nr:succinyldiaminopimelate transaminase [Campylobacterota bacterium]